VSHGSMRRLAILAGALVLVAALPLRAAAADDRIDFAVGYSLMHDSDVDGNFPLGWFASVGKSVTPMIGIVGDVSGNYKTINLAPDVDAKLRVHTFMAGPRWASRQGQMTPWAQVLFGAAHMSGSVFGIGDSETDFAWQPGGGIDYELNNGINLRFGANLRFIHSSSNVGKEFQFIAGIVMHGR
jgi:Outer membrane protein beta-barrel domain